MKTIAVLMTCYNRVETTLRCLRTLFAQKLPEGYALEVWLVDDASPDGTGAKVKAEFPQVNVVKSPGNLFWCKGMRLAWDTAAAAKDYDFYLWLNDDVILVDDAVATALSDYDSLADVPLRVVTGAFYDSAGGAREVCYVSMDKAGRRLVPNGIAPQRGCGWFGGNFVLVPRDVYRKVGPISGFYHHAYGDGDYALRLTEAGIPFYAPSKALGECQVMNVRVRALRDIPFGERIALLWKPNGFHLGDAFVYSLEHKGPLRAFVSVAHITLNVLLARGKIRGG